MTPATPPTLDEARPTEAELFRFEIPSARGKFVIIGPNDLTPEEAAALNRKLGAIIEAMFAPSPLVSGSPSDD